VSSSNVPASNDDTLKFGTAKFETASALDDSSAESAAAVPSGADGSCRPKVSVGVWQNAVAENSATAKVVISGLQNFFEESCNRISLRCFHTNALGYDAICGKE
jgi:hypothetical protein